MSKIAKILVIDDSVLICSMVENLFGSENTTVISVQTAEKAFLWLENHIPDAILLDLVLPDMDGYQVCAQIKSQTRAADVPIIFLTSNSDEQSVLKGFDAGATDFITKPFSTAVLKARVSCHLKNKIITDELRIAYKKLEHAMAEIRLQGMKDQLTGLFNRRYFIENMSDWRSAFPNQPMFFVIIDVDDFKYVNDNFGHCTGDYVLYTIADIIMQSISENAIAGRWGGDEFLVVLGSSSWEEIKAVTQRMVERIAAYPFCYDANLLHCHITAGVSKFDPKLTIEQNIMNADEALYEGKRKGKNGVSIKDIS